MATKEVLAKAVGEGVVARGEEGGVTYYSLPTSGQGPTTRVRTRRPRRAEPAASSVEPRVQQAAEEAPEAQQVEEEPQASADSVAQPPRQVVRLGDAHEAARVLLSFSKQPIAILSSVLARGFTQRTIDDLEANGDLIVMTFSQGLALCAIVSDGTAGLSGLSRQELASFLPCAWRRLTNVGGSSLTYEQLIREHRSGACLCYDSMVSHSVRPELGAA